MAIKRSVTLEPPDLFTRRILLLAPTGRDAALAAEALRAADMTVEVCRDMDSLTQRIGSGAGAVLIAQECLTPPEMASLGRTLANQPPWSDLPLIILTAGGRAADIGDVVLQTLDRLGNATFLERPVRMATLIRAVTVALRARERQYEIRQYLQEREQITAERLLLIEQQRTFLRDVLLSVTEGKLRLCATRDDLPQRLEMQLDPLILSRASLRQLRREVERVATVYSFDGERTDDLVTAVNEAGMNAVVHAGGGVAHITYSLEAGTAGDAEPNLCTLQIWIEDHGTGIEIAALPRATLERGYSSAGTFGHGFWMILKASDRTYLLTGPSGTTVVIEQDRTPPAPAWMQGIAIGD